MSLHNRLERAHRAEVEELKVRLGEGARVIESCEEAKKRLAEELALEKERARVREEELAGQTRRVEELGLEVEKVRKDLVASDSEVGRLEVQLDLRKRELEESESKVGRMNGLCRRQVRRILKDQRGEFQKVCRKQSRRAAKVVRNFLEARRPWTRADKLASQAEEAERILIHLRSEGVPIPEDKTAVITAAKEGYLAERARIGEITLSARDFEFDLPADLGVPNLDQVDFSAGFAFGEDLVDYWAASGDEGGRVEGEEGEVSEESAEGEEEEEEEEQVPLAGKGSASGSQPAEGDQVPAECATAVVQPGGDGLEEVSPAREGTPTTGRGVTAEVRSGGDAYVEKEKTPPAIEGTSAGGEAPIEAERTPLATEGATAEVPEGGGLERVQLEGDVTPPAPEE